MGDREPRRGRREKKKKEEDREKAVQAKGNKG